MEEDGDSDDERPLSGSGQSPQQHDGQQSPLSSKPSVGTAAVAIKVITVDFSQSTPPPEANVHPPDRKSQTTKGTIDSNSSEPEHAGCSSSGEGGVTINIGSGSKTRGLDKNIRAAVLWSKLRSIAYITSMQVGYRQHKHD